MRRDEARVARDFAGWLSSQGWTVRTDTDVVDIVADKDGRRLYVEVKGASSAPGLDVDTAIGQLVRRMPSEPDQSVSFALVVRDEPRSVEAAVRAHHNGFSICWGWRCMPLMTTVGCGSSLAACEDLPPERERGRSAVWRYRRQVPREWGSAVMGR
jgi:hypothetical protein